MIETLTTAQSTKLADYRERWLRIGLSTGPCDRAAVEAAIEEVYRCAGREPPTVKVWVASPRAGAVVAGMFAQVLDQYGVQVRDRVRDHVRDQCVEHVRVQVHAQVGSHVWDQVGDHVQDHVWDQIGEHVRAQVGDQVSARVRDQVYRCGYGTQDADWLAVFDFFDRECGLEEAVAPLSGLIHLAERGGGWWWPYERAVILSEQPVVLQLDAEGRLHAEEGPAVVYADGIGVWAQHGVRQRTQQVEE